MVLACNDSKSNDNYTVIKTNNYFVIIIIKELLITGFLLHCFAQKEVFSLAKLYVMI